MNYLFNDFFCFKREKKDANEQTGITKYYNSVKSFFNLFPLYKIIKYSTIYYICYTKLIDITMFIRIRYPNFFLIRRSTNKFDFNLLKYIFPGTFNNQMTVNEATLILNVPYYSGLNDVISSYKKLIQKNHPDFGGSSYIASKIIQAKELLVNHINGYDI